MAPTTISDNLFADSLINRGYNVEKVISYKRKKEIIEKEDADIIIFQKKILPGHKYQDIYKLKGKVFLCHIDDDFEGMNEEVYKKTLEISDLILVGNKAHAKNLSNYINTPVEVIVAISDFENYKFISINQKNNKNTAEKYAAVYRDIEDKFQGFFGTKVKIDAGRRSGKIIINYTNNDELERILGLIKHD